MSELRKDPISGKWVIIAPERMRRPSFLSQNDYQESNQENCPFCPGNEHYTGQTIQQKPDNGDWKVRAFPNKYPALRVEGDVKRKGHGIYDVISGVGAHEIIVNTPQHGQEISSLPEENLIHLLQLYQTRILDLYNDTRLRYAMIYINHGPEAGATVAHSHSQLIATAILPNLIKDELLHCKEYFVHKERCLICDIIDQEKNNNERIVSENDYFIAIVPYAARVPFEVQIYPKNHSHDYGQCSTNEIKHLSAMIKDVMRRLRQALNSPPYNMVLHSTPNTRAQGIPGQWQTLLHDFHWHIEIVPRLTLAAGFEWGTGYFINPSEPEQCAKFLREL